MHGARINDQVDTIDALIQAGGSIELGNNRGETPLGSAAYHSTTQSILVLLRHGAEIGAPAKNGNTPRHSACRGQFPGLEGAVNLLLRWRADETAVNDEGRTPMELFGLAESPWGNRYCSPDEIDHARLTFARAPADKDWRRRSWLVMLRSRASKTKMASREMELCSGVDWNDAAGRLEWQVCEVARREYANRDGDGGVGGAIGEREGLFCGLVATLVEMEVEGVFRMVVKFL